MSWCRRLPEPKSNGAVLFLFVGFVLTLLLAGVVITKSMAGKRPVPVEPIAGDDRTDPSAALPAGISAAVGPLEIEGAADPSFVFAYRHGSAPAVGLVRWDRKTRRYRQVSEAVLSVAPYGFSSVDSLSDGPVWGITPIITVRGPSSADPRVRSVTFVAVYPTLLSQINFAAGDALMPVEFLAGTADTASWDLEVRDVNGDGVPEVLQHEMYRLGDVETDETSVFVWDYGRLKYDEQLSWALTVRAELFPEPDIE